jgi:hypothetical protein
MRWVSTPNRYVGDLFDLSVGVIKNDRWGRLPRGMIVYWFRVNIPEFP